MKGAIAWLSGNFASFDGAHAVTVVVQVVGSFKRGVLGGFVSSHH